MSIDGKIIESLTMLMEAYTELQKSVRNDFGAGEPDDDVDETHDLQVEVDAAIVTELRTSIETVIDTEDYAPEEIASALSSLSEALEEIDPDVFASEEEDDEDEEYEDDDLEELDDLDDLDDYDDEDYEDDDYEEDDEDYEEEEEEDD